MAKKKKVILPRHPSTLLKIAIADMRAARRAGMAFDMDVWLEPPGWGNATKCTVCMAGAVMAGTLGMAKCVAATGRGIGPGEYEDNFDQLEAINLLRTGGVDDALTALGIEQLGGDLDRQLDGTVRGRWREFMIDMHQLIKDLEAVGL